MSFSKEDINAANAKVKTGADFPALLQELTDLGVVDHAVYVADGRAEYRGKDGQKLPFDAAYPELKIEENVDKERFVERLKLHQQGGTDFPTFCKDCAATGIDHWVIDNIAKTCSYFSNNGELILVETIGQ